MFELCPWSCGLMHGFSDQYFKKTNNDQYCKLLKRSPYLLKGDGLGIFYLTYFNNWKKYWVELLFDFRNKKSMFSEAWRKKTKGLGANSKSPLKCTLDVNLCLYFVTLQWNFLYHLAAVTF